MKQILKIIGVTFFFLSISGKMEAQLNTKNNMENKETNPLLCDIESGSCEMPGQHTTADHQAQLSGTKPVKIIYFTDPICSSCWGIEPQLKKLKLEYGHLIDIEYRMGGLLPNWDYNSGGISKPVDVAVHWEEAGAYYDMPIDGDVWYVDPLESSYPPSIAVKAAELQSEEKAVYFMRKLREGLFLSKKNIAKWENIADAAKEAGLDVEQLEKDYESAGKMMFQADLNLARKMGVRGFPTIFLLNEAGMQELVYGSRPYDAYENAIKKLYPEAVKNKYANDYAHLFSQFDTMTAKEFSVLSGMPRNEVEGYLNKLVSEGKLKRFDSKNGGLWSTK